MQSAKRRKFLRSVLLLGASASAPLLAQSPPNTPECRPGRGTPAQTEGPYYTRDTPHKRSFRTDARGEPIVLEGAVLTTACRPVAGAWLDFWHADAAGEYDNAGYRLRGHLFADAAGRYRLETILPGIYPGRARHIHVKVAAPDRARILTTQVYFPDDPSNAGDGLYRAELVARRAGGALRFDFLIAA
jgi:protocatechuate 3,4-dioxygenase beta subunit